MGFVDFERFKPKSDSIVIRLSLGKTNGVICGQKRPSGGHIWFKRSQMEIWDRGPYDGTGNPLPEV